MQVSSIIEINKISYKYRKDSFNAISDISLNIKKGNFLSVVGPNGAGKTTLLKCVCGVLFPDKGSVEINSKDINDYKQKEIAKTIAYLPQESFEWYDISVFEFVLTGRYPHLKGLCFPSDADIEIVEECISLCGISDIKESKLSELSGGQKQRVRFASSLAQKPDVLVLDEPTSYLDIASEALFFKLLSEFSRKGIGVVITTHDLNYASLFSDVICMLYKGEIYKTGSPADVITQETLDLVYGKGFKVKEDEASGKPYVMPLTYEV
jgi:iron complex transport system ATP-binding protein